jgi:hypothetical protein
MFFVYVEGKCWRFLTLGLSHPWARPKVECLSCWFCPSPAWRPPMWPSMLHHGCSVDKGHAVQTFMCLGSPGDLYNAHSDLGGLDKDHVSVFLLSRCCQCTGPHTNESQRIGAIIKFSGPSPLVGQYIKVALVPNILITNLGCHSPWRRWSEEGTREWEERRMM